MQMYTKVAFSELAKEMSIMVVDDEKVHLMACEEMLKQYFRGVYGFADPIEAIQFYKDREVDIDIVMTDIKMPVMSGLEMSRRIKKINHECSIVVLSCSEDNELLLDAIEANIHYYMIKPFDPDKHLPALFPVMEKQKMRLDLKKAKLDKQLKKINKAKRIKIDLFLENIPFPSVVLCEKGTMMEWNKRFKELFCDMENRPILEEIKKRNKNFFTLFYSEDWCNQPGGSLMMCSDLVHEECVDKNVEYHSESGICDMNFRLNMSELDSDLYEEGYLAILYN